MSKLYVPSEILRVFKSLHPDVDLDQVEWEWEVPGKIYEAEFTLNDQEYEVEITVTGHHLLTETSIKHAIPNLVRETLAEKYPKHQIESCDLVAYSNGDMQYEIDLRPLDSEESFEVLIREDGLFIIEGSDL